jgi:hypothetical protein
VALPKALNDGFLGRPTGADLSNVGLDVEATEGGFAGNAEEMGTPNRAAVDVASGLIEVEAEAEDADEVCADIGVGAEVAG